MVKVQVNSQGQAYIANGRALVAHEGSAEPVIESITITPTISEQIINVQSDIDGYAPITVSPVTSEIDNNILSNNIKKDVTILGVTGSYEGSSGSSTKYGASLDTLLGNINSSGVLQEPSGTSTDLVFTDVEDIADYVLDRKFGSKHYSFDGNSTISTVSFPDLTNISGTSACWQAFYGCPNLTSASFPSLTTISGNSAFEEALSHCPLLTTVSLPALSLISVSNALKEAFTYDSSLRSLSFPALNTNSFGSNTNQFNDMLRGCSNVTVHFPYTLESTLENWTSVKNGFGGSNTSVLYDIGAGVVNFNTNQNIVTYLSYKTKVNNNKPQYTNYTKWGNPTINIETGDVSGFSWQNYLTIDDITTSCDILETVICFTTPNNVSEVTQTIFYGGGTNEIVLESSHVCLLDAMYSYEYFDFGLDSLSSNTKYWFKLVVDNLNSEITGYLSTDGINYTAGSSSTWPMAGSFTPGTTVGYGALSDFSGILHLAGCYVNGDNVQMWNPAVPGQNSFTTYINGNLPYQTYFPNNNVVDYQVVNNVIEGETRNISISEPQNSIILTVTVNNNEVNEVVFKVGNISIPITKSSDVYTINIANGLNNTIGYEVEATSTTMTTIGTITLTGNNQSETITLTPKASSNITINGEPTINTSTGEVSDLNYAAYLESNYNLPTNEFEFISKIKFYYDSNSWDTGTRSAFDFPSTNRIGYWEAYDPWNQTFGASLPSFENIMSGVYFDGECILFIKYIQSGTTVSMYYAQDYSEEWTKDTVPSEAWTLCGEFDTSMYGDVFPIESGTGTITIGESWDWPNGASIFLNDTCIRSTDDSTIYWEPIL